MRVLKYFDKKGALKLMATIDRHWVIRSLRYFSTNGMEKPCEFLGICDMFSGGHMKTKRALRISVQSNSGKGKLTMFWPLDDIGWRGVESAAVHAQDGQTVWHEMHDGKNEEDIVDDLF